MGLETQRGDGGGAALMTWGRAVGNADEFRSWHNLEHLPERAQIAGFRRCRRFRSLEGRSLEGRSLDGRSLDGACEFFCLYELSHAGVLQEPAYSVLMHAPSAWTRTMLATPAPGVARTIAVTRFAAERGLGGTVAVWRYDSLPPPARLDRLRNDVLPAFARHPAIAALRLFERAEAAQDTDQAALKSLASLVIPHAVIIAEGWGGDDALRNACAAMSSEMPQGTPSCRYYQMEVMMTGDHERSNSSFEAIR